MPTYMEEGTIAFTERHYEAFMKLFAPNQTVNPEKDIRRPGSGITASSPLPGCPRDPRVASLLGRARVRIAQLEKGSAEHAAFYRDLCETLGLSEFYEGQGPNWAKPATVLAFVKQLLQERKDLHARIDNLPEETKAAYDRGFSDSTKADEIFGLGVGIMDGVRAYQARTDMSEERKLKGMGSLGYDLGWNDAYKSPDLSPPSGLGRFVRVMCERSEVVDVTQFPLEALVNHLQHAVAHNHTREDVANQAADIALAALAVAAGYRQRVELQRTKSYALKGAKVTVGGREIDNATVVLTYPEKEPSDG